MGGSYRKGGGLEEMGVESTLMANQMRRGANVGEESWQEAEWRSVGVCQSKSAGGAAVSQHKARGCCEHSPDGGPPGDEKGSRRWLPGEPDPLEVPPTSLQWNCAWSQQMTNNWNAVWWDNHRLARLLTYPKCMLGAVGASCSFIQPSGRLTWSDVGDVRKAGCYFTAC